MSIKPARKPARTALVLTALLLSSPMLAGCAVSMADLPLIGTPADAPGRPKEVSAYLPVGEVPQDRDEATLEPAQRAKIQAELIAARDRQASSSAGQNTSTK